VSQIAVIMVFNILFELVYVVVSYQHDKLKYFCISTLQMVRVAFYEQLHYLSNWILDRFHGKIENPSPSLWLLKRNKLKINNTITVLLIVFASS